MLHAGQHDLELYASVRTVADLQNAPFQNVITSEPPPEGYRHHGPQIENGRTATGPLVHASPSVPLLPRALRRKSRMSAGVNSVTSQTSSLSSTTNITGIFHVTSSHQRSHPYCALPKRRRQRLPSCSTS